MKKEDPFDVCKFVFGAILSFSKRFMKSSYKIQWPTSPSRPLNVEGKKQMVWDEEMKIILQLLMLALLPKTPFLIPLLDRQWKKNLTDFSAPGILR